MDVLLRAQDGGSRLVCWAEVDQVIHRIIRHDIFIRVSHFVFALSTVTQAL